MDILFSHLNNSSYLSITTSAQGFKDLIVFVKIRHDTKSSELGLPFDNLELFFAIKVVVLQICIDSEPILVLL